MRSLLLLLLATACGTRSDAAPTPDPTRAEPLAEARADAGTDALLPNGALMPDAGLLVDAGKPMAP
jgi:hypothetical protein